MSANLVDSCGWLEYFSDGINADRFAAAIEDVEHLVVPTLCVAEVFKTLLRERDENTAFAAVSAMSQGRVIELDARLAMDAAKLGLLHRLPLADSVIYATAKAEGALLWTQDAHFENLAGVKFVPKE
jgi:predicted nucleic acid-binding protein